MSLLIATGFSICGASAIGAMAAVRRIRQHDTVLPVALVTLCGTLAIGVLPLLIRPLGLSPEVFGAWAGASVHDVGQVVATAQTAGAVGAGRRRRRQTHPGDPAGAHGRRRRACTTAAAPTPAPD